MAKRRARPEAPAGVYIPGEPCPVCGATLFLVREIKGARCLVCRSNLYVERSPAEPVGRATAARGVGGYVRSGATAFARQ